MDETEKHEGERCPGMRWKRRGVRREQADAEDVEEHGGRWTGRMRRHRSSIGA